VSMGFSVCLFCGKIGKLPLRWNDEEL